MPNDTFTVTPQAEALIWRSFKKGEHILEIADTPVATVEHFTDAKGSNYLWGTKIPNFGWDVTMPFGSNRSLSTAKKAAEKAYAVLAL